MDKKKTTAIDGMLPIILDGTGRNLEFWSSQADIMKNIGYDTAMVFVTVSLETALKRNRARTRSISDDDVISNYNDVMKNRDAYKRKFGKNFIEIVNDEDLKGAQLAKFKTVLTKKANKFLSAPLKNPIGIKKINKLKEIGGKYLSDLPPGTISDEYNPSFKSFYNK